MTRRLKTYLTVLLFMLLIPRASAGGAEYVFKTKYTVIHFTNDSDLLDFVWRIGGVKTENVCDISLMTNRVDRIVERVGAILGMGVDGTSINVYLVRGSLPENDVAFYQCKMNSIGINVDAVNDGVFAHEVSHAVVDQFYKVCAPTKTLEIVSQYVDKYLWQDY